MTIIERAHQVVDAARDTLVELSHTIHAHPELGYEEFISSRAVAAVAEDAGFHLERKAAGLDTAFCATAGSGSLRIALCAEFDALPDIGHACGHNIIAASSTGAALALAAVADEIDATIVLFGTPSEEGGGGKIDLINAGYFDDIHAAMMVHPFPHDRLDSICLAVDHFDVTYGGKEAHASMAPWEGINALDAYTIANVALGQLRQQLPPGDQFHGIIREGGSAANIIPARVVARYMCRSVSADRLRTLRERVNNCFRAGSIATGASVSFEDLGNRFSHMETNLDILAHYRLAAEAIGRTFDRDDAGIPMPTLSTDMGNVSLVVPSIHPLLGIETDGAINHQPAFTAAAVNASADRAVLDGAKALAGTAIGVASDAALRAKLVARVTAKTSPT